MRILDGKLLINKFGIDYFKEGSSFGALSEEAIRFLIEKGKVLELDKGEQIFAFGDPGDSFYIVIQGKIQFCKPRKNGDTHIRDYTFGQEFGCIAMFGLHNRVGNNYADEDSIILNVSSELFFELHDKLPTDFGLMMLNLSREMARLLRASDNKLGEHDIHI